MDTSGSGKKKKKGELSPKKIEKREKTNEVTRIEFSAIAGEDDQV